MTTSLFIFWIGEGCDGPTSGFTDRKYRTRFNKPQADEDKSQRIRADPRLIVLFAMSIPMPVDDGRLDRVKVLFSDLLHQSTVLFPRCPDEYSFSGRRSCDGSHE